MEFYELHQMDSTEKVEGVILEGTEKFPIDLPVPLHDILLDFHEIFMNLTTLITQYQNRLPSNLIDIPIFRKMR